MYPIQSDSEWFRVSYRAYHHLLLNTIVNQPISNGPCLSVCRPGNDRYFGYITQCFSVVINATERRTVVHGGRGSLYYEGRQFTPPLINNTALLVNGILWFICSDGQSKQNCRVVMPTIWSESYCKYLNKTMDQAMGDLENDLLYFMLFAKL